MDGWTPAWHLSPSAAASQRRPLHTTHQTQHGRTRTPSLSLCVCLCVAMGTITITTTASSSTRSRGGSGSGSSGLASLPAAHLINETQTHTPPSLHDHTRTHQATIVAIANRGPRRILYHSHTHTHTHKQTSQVTFSTDCTHTQRRQSPSPTLPYQVCLCVAISGRGSR